MVCKRRLQNLNTVLRVYAKSHNAPFVVLLLGRGDFPPDRGIKGGINNLQGLGMITKTSPHPSPPPWGRVAVSPEGDSWINPLCHSVEILKVRACPQQPFNKMPAGHRGYPFCPHVFLFLWEDFFLF